jgi:hypothetical protein
LDEVGSEPEIVGHFEMIEDAKTRFQRDFEVWTERKTIPATFRSDSRTERFFGAYEREETRFGWVFRGGKVKRSGAGDILRDRSS